MEGCSLRIGHLQGLRSVLRLMAPCPILVTESGITMLVRPVQSSKAQSPISVTESGMTMLVRLQAAM